MNNPNKPEPECGVCGSHGPQYLHARCHISAPTWSRLDGDVLTIECSECRKKIVQFHVIQPTARTN